MAKYKVIGMFMGKLYTILDLREQPYHMSYLLRDIHWIPACRMSTDIPKIIEIDDKVKVQFT